MKKLNTSELALPSIETVVPHTKEMDTTVNIAAKARELIVKDQPAFNEAGALLKDVKYLDDALEEQYKRFADPHNEALKAVREWFRPSRDALKEIKGLLNEKMSAFVVSEQDRRKLEQAKLNEKAEIERIRLEERADKLEADGKFEQAEALRERASGVMPEVIDMPVKNTAVQTRTVWHGEITDKKKFIKAIADGIIPESMVEVEQGRLDKMGQQSQGAFDWPGVKWFKTAEFRRSKK